MDHRKEVKLANKRGSDLLSKTLVAKKAHYNQRIGKMIIDLSNGALFGFEPKSVQGLEHAAPFELKTVEISPSGLGLYFPLLDADIYVPSLLQGIFGSQKWMAQHLGRLGGKVTSPAKVLASRQNGQLGGRPKKIYVSQHST